jgi:uncharacterized protein YggU (UPF0235/DUF167 family)
VILEVTVKPGSKVVKIEKHSPTTWVVWIKQKPIEGKANKELISLISKEFNLPQSKVKILQGEHFKKKIIEVDK